MKFQCSKDILNSALNAVTRVCAVKSPNPALEGILVCADGDTVTVNGYNMEIGITATINANITEPGRCVIPNNLICDIVRRMPGEMVTVYVDSEYQTTIQSGITTYKVMALDCMDYPNLPDVEYNSGILINQKTLRDMIAGTVFAISDNQTRPVHTGSLFEIVDDVLTLVSVDGIRLALRRTKVNAGRGMKFVVPGNAMKELEKMLTDPEEDVEITLGTRHISFRSNNITLITRILEGEFLDYNRVIPQDNPILMTVERELFRQCVERMTPIIPDIYHSPVRCSFNDREIELRASSEVGTVYDGCPATGNGNGIEIGFNCRYMTEVLKNIPDEYIHIEMSTGIKPVIMKSSEGDDYVYMILPVRLK